MWALNIHGSLHSVPLKKYLSWHQPLGQWSCPLCLWGWCKSCQALSPAGCCAALEPSLAGKPGHGECSTLHWGGREAALRVTVAKLPSISQLQDRTVLLCNLWPFYILVIYVLVMREASGPHLTLHCSSSSQTLCGGWVHPLQLQHHSWDIVLINSQGA